MAGATNALEAQCVVPLLSRPMGKVTLVAKCDFFADGNIAGCETGDFLSLDGVGDVGVGHAGVVEAGQEDEEAVVGGTAGVGEGKGVFGTGVG